MTAPTLATVFHQWARLGLGLERFQRIGMFHIHTTFCITVNTEVCQPSPVHADFNNADVLGGGYTPRARVSKLSVVELHREKQRIAFEEYSRLVVRFLTWVKI